MSDLRAQQRGNNLEKTEGDGLAPQLHGITLVCVTYGVHSMGLYFLVEALTHIFKFMRISAHEMKMIRL